MRRRAIWVLYRLRATVAGWFDPRCRARLWTFQSMFPTHRCGELRAEHGTKHICEGCGAEWPV